MWRAILRCSDKQSSSTGTGLSGIWGNVTIEFDASECEEIMLEGLIGISVSHEESAKDASFLVRASNDCLSQHERGFVTWIRQRVVGAESIHLQCERYIQDPGWMFAELVLAVSTSGGHFSARPPVKLYSGMGSSIHTESGLVIDGRICSTTVICFSFVHKACLLLLCRSYQFTFVESL